MSDIWDLVPGLDSDELEVLVISEVSELIWLSIREDDLFELVKFESRRDITNSKE
jgi:hypothetical protein